MPPLPLRHQFPPHSFDSHHLRLAFAPLRACSSHPCFGFEPSALRVRRRSVTSLPQKPGTQNAHAFASHFVSCSWLEPSALALRFSSASAVCGLRSRLASVSLRRHAPSPAPCPPLLPPSPAPASPPAPPSFAATQNLMQTAVLISSMSKPLTLIIIILLTIGFIVAVVGVSGGFLLNS